MGSAPYYVAAVSLYRMFERPYIISGIGIFVGYVQAMLKRLPRYENSQYRRFFRGFELRSLLLGKRRTMRKYHDRVREAFPNRSRSRTSIAAAPSPASDAA